jgi:putative flippase GtrA
MRSIGRGSSWFVAVGEWIRHRAGALVATAVDFGIMIALVELLHLGPVVATVTGALCGSLSNFFLGRTWIFHRTDARAAGQMVRYAVVSGASLGLNSLGEYYLVVRLGVGYVLARVIVATVVGNLWNYPLHKFFVFGRRPKQPPQG